jgi:Xaa-Pro aminopeptidase
LNADRISTTNPGTLFPIQHKLIVTEMLSDAEIGWINDYHATVCASIAPLLEQQGRSEALAWLQANTTPLTR